MLVVRPFFSFRTNVYMICTGTTLRRDRCQRHTAEPKSVKHQGSKLEHEKNAKLKVGKQSSVNRSNKLWFQRTWKKKRQSPTWTRLLVRITWRFSISSSRSIETRKLPPKREQWPRTVDSAVAPGRIQVQKPGEQPYERSMYVYIYMLGFQRDR